MSESKSSSKSKLATFIGSLGGMLIFLVVITIAYLPHRPEPIDTAIDEARQLNADEVRAAGLAKINDYSVALDGTVQIPIEKAMELVLEEYRD